MVPSFLCFIVFNENDVDTQKRSNRLLSQELIEENHLDENQKKFSDPEIEIVELAQSISRKNTESPELQESLNLNYFQSLKNIMASKVRSNFLIKPDLLLTKSTDLHLFNAFDLIPLFYRDWNTILGHRLF